MISKRIFGFGVWASATVIGAVSTCQASADFVVYSNLTTYSGYAFTNDGVATVTPGDDYTALIADDIQTAGGSGGDLVTSFSWTVANFNSSAVAARTGARIYAADGAGGGPGTLLSEITFAARPFPAHSGQTITTPVSHLSPYFTIPANGMFWAGTVFNTFPALSTTAAQLARLGQLSYNPPTVGSSQDELFTSSTTSDFTTDNPPGDISPAGGTPIANLGWSFTAELPSSVPEPASLCMLGLGGMALLARRGRKA